MKILLKLFALIFMLSICFNGFGQKDSLKIQDKKELLQKKEYKKVELPKEPLKVQVINQKNEALKDYVLPITSLTLAVVALLVTIFIYRNQNKRDRKEKTLEFSRRHETFEFYIQVLSPVWKMSIKWKYLPAEEREKYRRVIAMGWIGFESQEPIEILKNWIPDFKSQANYVHEHYLKKLNINSQTEHEALTMYIHFWTEFWQAIEQNLIDKKLCSTIAQQYAYHEDFFRELRNYIRKLKENEFSNDPLPIWILYNEKLEKFFMNLKK